MNAILPLCSTKNDHLTSLLKNCWIESKFSLDIYM